MLPDFGILCYFKNQKLIFLRIGNIQIFPKFTFDFHKFADQIKTKGHGDMSTFPLTHAYTCSCKIETSLSWIKLILLAQVYLGKSPKFEFKIASPNID